MSHVFSSWGLVTMSKWGVVDGWLCWGKCLCMFVCLRVGRDEESSVVVRQCSVSWVSVPLLILDMHNMVTLRHHVDGHADDEQHCTHNAQ